MDESNQSSKGSYESSKSQTQSSKPKPTRKPGPTFSPSVEYAYKKVSPTTAFPALLFAYRLLERHKDYVPSLYPKVFATLEQRFTARNSTNRAPLVNSQTIDKLLRDATSMINVDKVPVLHGRVALIALSMIDDELYGILSQDSYLEKLSEEIREQMEDVFEPDAYQIFQVKIQKSGMNDTVANHTDHALTSKKQDKLDRYAFAEFLVKLLDNTVTDKEFGSYSLHLYAPWGTGKTSTLNFMKEIMKEGGSTGGSYKWHIVDFNAWQNQHLEYPWWFMMDSIYKQVWRSLLRRPGKLISELTWRINRQALNYFFGISVVLLIAFFFLVPAINKSEGSITDVSTLLDNVGKGVGGILALWAFVLGIGRYLSSRNTKDAETYLTSRKDPMNSFHKRFKNIIEAIRPNRVAIFIDDLDRCKSSYVISLLESLQTLFNNQNVFFIIAADNKWINACYEVEYNSIKSYISPTEKPIGTLFIEKMFQQSVALPGVHSEMKKKLWNSLLSAADAVDSAPDNSLVDQMKRATTIEQTENILSKAKMSSFQTDHAFRLAAVKKMADSKNVAQTENLLEPYGVYLDLNPRTMKRLLNSYSTIKASAVISHIDIPIHQTVLWTILTMRWPVIAECLLQHAEVVDNTISLNPANFPASITALFREKELNDLLNGSLLPEKRGLEAHTILQFRQLLI